MLYINNLKNKKMDPETYYHYSNLLTVEFFYSEIEVLDAKLKRGLISIENYIRSTNTLERDINIIISHYTKLTNPIIV